MIVTGEAIGLALKDVHKIDRAIQKLDYIQIVFIFDDTVADLEGQRLFNRLDVWGATTIAHQRHFPTKYTCEHNAMGITLRQRPLKMDAILREAERLGRYANLIKCDLHVFRQSLFGQRKN